MQTGAAWLGAKLKAHAGTAVKFRRAGHEVSVTATRAMAEHEVSGPNGFLTKVHTVDRKFTAVDLVLLGEVIKPRPRDEIEADGVVFQAMNLGERECAEPADAAGILIVVHTKQVSP